MTINDLLLHQETKKQLGKLVQHNAHTIALTGMQGMGKKTVALSLAAELLRITPDELQKYPYVRIYSPTKNSITIESARDIIGFTTLKTVGEGNIRRIIIIEDAHLLTLEAQNALLKSFEEPPADTVFILTITSTSQVLPTILSRAHVLPIVAPTKEQTTEYFLSKNHSAPNVQQYYFMSGGLPGLMSALLSESENHPFVQSVNQAKTILQSDSFQRLAMIDEIAKNKGAKELTEALKRISNAALLAEATKETSNKQAFKKWTTILAAAQSASQKLSRNGQEKLILTDLFLHI